MQDLIVPTRRRRAKVFAPCLGALAAMFMTQVVIAASPVPAASSARVAVEDFAFTPSSITIAVGGSVVWAVRKDPEQHTVTPTEADAFVGSGQLSDGDDYAITFGQPGIYEYVCSLHPFMTGTVIVEAVASTAPTAAPLASVASVGSVASVSPGPSSTEPIDGGSGSTTGVVILTLILLAFMAGAGALLWRRSTRREGGGGPTG
ncbi:MAG: plastocyanin/azurin family copper-binding protein [Candidatus Limnocylindrales bacterium]